MKRYLIVRTTKDGLGIEQLSVVQEFDDRKDAMEYAKTLKYGVYSLLSVLRPEFEVRESVRISTPVVNWGTTRQPRKRKDPTTSVGDSQ